MEESNYPDLPEAVGETGSEFKAPESRTALNDIAGDPPDDDVYVLLQGPAHIKPLNSTGDGIEVTFLDETGEPTKTPINFTFDLNANPPFTALKVLSLQLIIECSKTDFEALKQSGALKNYFPKIYNEIVKTPDNMPFMNPPDPPFNRPK